MMGMRQLHHFALSFKGLEVSVGWQRFSLRFRHITSGS